jgi:hypothetical protein
MLIFRWKPLLANPTIFSSSAALLFIRPPLSSAPRLVPCVYLHTPYRPLSLPFSRYSDYRLSCRTYRAIYANVIELDEMYICSSLSSNLAASFSHSLEYYPDQGI